MDSPDKPTPAAPDAPTGEKAEQQTIMPEVETVSAETLAAPIVDNMPKPTGTASNETVATPEPVPQNVPADTTKPDPYASVRDNFGKGKLWNRELYLADDSGAPRYDKRGFFISVNKGQAGRKNKLATENSGAQPAAESVPSAATPEPTASATVTGQPDIYDQTAEMYLQVGYGIASAALGNGIRPEFKIEKRVSQGLNGAPDTEEEVIKFTAEVKLEHESLRVPLAMVLREKQATGLTPTQMFMASLAAFIAKKAAKPTVRERFVLIYLKVKGWFTKSQLPK